jgi:DNA polymerase
VSAAPPAGDDVRAAVVAWLRFCDAAGIDLALEAEPRAWWREVEVATPPAATDPTGSAAAPASGAATVAPVLPRPAARAPALPLGAGPPADARKLAAGAESVAQLVELMRGFDGCGLARTAMNLCVGDGDPSSPLMLVGEAPGAEEDRQGKPFVGKSGQLLDRMLAAAGRPRHRTWITNTVFWRPPGNRSPTAQELATCLPFVERQIELIRPRALLFVGGIAVRALLNLEEGVTKLRGRKFRYPLADGDDIPATVMFHPAYLLRRPQLKGLAWRDLLAATAMVDEI